MLDIYFYNELMKIVAKTLIFDKQGKILILRRSGTHPRFAHHFDLPGGEVEQDEVPANTVAREIREETGLIIETSRLKLGFEKRLSNELAHMLFVTNLDSVRPEIILSWEHDTYEWLWAKTLLDEPLPRNTDPYYIDVVKWLGSRPAS